MKKQDIITLWISHDIKRDDVFLMLQNILDISSKELFLLDDIPADKIPDIKKAFSKYSEGMPLEYIIWETEFYGYKFFVSEDALIPRNDTEVLVEKAVEYINNLTPNPSPTRRGEQNITLVDVWTGTGCIPISIYKQSGDNIKQCFAIDISPAAVKVAEKNAEFHNLQDKIEFFHGDLLTSSSSFLLQEGGTTHLVVTANLPYIKDNDFENIDERVNHHEPHLALFWWPDTGFELYEKLVSQLQSIKAHDITLFIEIGFDQWDIVRDFCIKQKINFEIYRDNWWIDRCVQMKIR